MIPTATIPKEALPRKERGARDAREGTRTCVGCQARFTAGTAAPEDVHVRVVLGPSEGAARPELAVDLAESKFGRGAHVHARPSCLERACRAGFARAFKRPIQASPKALAQQIVDGAHARVRGLLLGARRARLLAFGEEAREAVGSGKAGLALVAVDAGSSGTKGGLRGAVEEGRVIAFGTKAELGAMFGREEVAVVAVLHEGVAGEIHAAQAAADGMTALARG